MDKLFAKFANVTARATGSPPAFLICVALVVLWAVTGPIFKFSETWQLVINTGTTIITFLMVFLIQNTQNREAKATQIKLDELIRATGEAHNALLDLEDLSEKDIVEIRKRYLALAAKAHDEEDREIGEARQDIENAEEHLEKAEKASSS